MKISAPSVSSSPAGSEGGVDRPAAPAQARRRPWATVLAGAAILALTALFAAANWHWLSVNVVTYGWDRMDHLITSLVYHDMVKGWSLRTPFDLLSYSSYYPPLFHYGIVALYRIFGVDEDVAAMVNVIYLGVLLASTYAITRRLAGRWVALFAAFLVGALPMIFAMSRYLYIDFALTAMVALALALLLATERFQRRDLSLWFGVGLGLAFLVKWTTAAFLAAPLIYLVARSGVLSGLYRRPRLLLPNWLRLGAAFLAAAAINLLIFLPAGAAVNGTKLGLWLLPLLTLFLAGALYAVFAVRATGPAPARAAKNALSAAAVAAWLVSLWYLINPEFADYFAYTAYGRDQPFMAFGKYFGEVVQQEIGLGLSLVFLIVAVVWLWQQRRRLPRTLSDAGWLLALWVVVPYFIFSFRVTLAHPRYVMPLLPPFAIWIAVGLAQWRPPWLRAAAFAAVALFAAVQFAVISFDELAGWRRSFVTAGAGQPVNWLGHGFSIQFPASERTDPGFAVAPKVLAIVDQARRQAGQENINLGLLVNSYQVHEKHFLYQIYKNYPHVVLRELARNWSKQPAYNQLFEMDYVLVSDTHDFRTNKNSQAAAQRILFDAEDAFNQAFRPVDSWKLPNGETVTLYARRFAPVEPGAAAEDYLTLLQLFGDRLGPGDAVVLTSPDQVYSLDLALPADAGAQIAPLPMDGASAAGTAERLTALAAARDRIFLVSHNADKVDPAGSIEGWLRQHATAGGDLWAGSIRVTPFIPQAPGASAAAALPVQAQWPGGLQLQSAAASATPAAGGAAAPGQVQAVRGGALVVTLHWSGVAAAPRKASLQLLKPDGSLAAQEDRDLVDGQQQFVLMVPRSAAPGAYRLALAVYDPATLQRAPTSTGAEIVELGTVQMAPAPARPVNSLPELRHPSDTQNDEE